MRRTIALALCALAIPGAARSQAEPPGWSWGDDPAPAQPSVDVSVGIGAPGAAIGFSTFQEGLSPYGQWIALTPYGQVWRPAGVPAGWRPYYYGRWEWTDEGWLWVSDEPFGWATYHYGRWAYDPTYGWVWVPGYQWAPAWVTWRYGPDAVGWAPLAPGFSVYVSAFPVVHSWWTFVPCGYFAGYPIERHAYAPAYVPRAFAATRPAPPRAVAYGHAAPAWGGAARGFVEGRIGRTIPTSRVQPVASPGAVRAPLRPGVVPIYRPDARPGPVPPRSPAPFAPGPAAAPAPRAWSPPPAARPASPLGRPAPALQPARPAPPALQPAPRPPAPGPPPAPGAAPHETRPAPAPAPASGRPQGGHEPRR